MNTRVLVTGAGGFIGHHVVKYLVSEGYWVRGVDIKYPEYEPSAAHEFELLDLRRFDNCLIATRGVDEVSGCCPRPKHHRQRIGTGRHPSPC